jgi:hypothetical protein
MLQVKPVLCDICSEKSELYVSQMFGVLGWHCQLCINYDYQVSEVDGVTPVQSDQTEQSLWYAGNGQSSNTFTALSTCTHNLTPFALTDKLTVYLSGSRHFSGPMEGPSPDIGVYLDDSWIEDSLMTNDGSLIRLEEEIPILYVGWKDFDVIELPDLIRVINWIMPKLFAGDNIEIGCMGGHGRTGTLACALWMTLHPEDTWGDAINFVRKTYCKSAVESVKQDNLLVELEDHIKGLTYEN